MAAESVMELKKWVSEVSRKRTEGEALPLARALELISKTFGTTLHEVAILGLTPNGKSLRFLAPDSLRAVGQIPLSSANALAAKTCREMRPEIVNHFYVVPHASVFEGVPVSETERGDPIQKIMSSPVMLGNQAIGVVQVSRKGKTSADAGPDFTPPQLHTLKTISDALVPCLLICAKE
jgi:hypothetical protein